MKTTVTLHPRTIKYLSEIARQRGIKESDLLRICLFKWFLTHRKGIRFFRKSVAYQAADGIRYRRVHVRFSPFEYESLIDCRKFLKRSVSSIATEAIYEFAITDLKEFVEMDTYPFPKYKVKHIIIKSHIIWNIDWFPTEPIRAEAT